MGWDSNDLEGDADWLYRRAGVDPGTPAPPIWLATELLGAGSVAAARFLREPGGACLVRVSGQVRIYYRASLPPEYRNFAVAHELAHWCLRDRAGGDTEAACDYLAAALVAPRVAFLKVVQRHGARFSRLAKAFATTESLVALRYGETTLEPIALVAPLSVRVRGAAYSWPSEPAIRAMAAGPKPGLRKAVLRDQPLRTALRAL
jgi:hypothetical protein